MEKILSSLFGDEQHHSIRNERHVIIKDKITCELRLIFPECLQLHCEMLQIKQFSSFHILGSINTISFQIYLIISYSISEDTDSIVLFNPVDPNSSHQARTILNKRNGKVQPEKTNFFYFTWFFQIECLLRKWKTFGVVLDEISNIENIFDEDGHLSSGPELQFTPLDPHPHCALAVDLQNFPTIVRRVCDFEAGISNFNNFLHFLVNIIKISRKIAIFTDDGQIFPFSTSFFTLSKESIQLLLIKQKPQMISQLLLSLLSLDLLSFLLCLHTVKSICYTIVHSTILKQIHQDI